MQNHKHVCVNGAHLSMWGGVLRGVFAHPCESVCGCERGGTCGGGVRARELRCREQGPHDADTALRDRDPQYEFLFHTLVCPV